MWWEQLKKNILDTDLYTRSGTEVGLSEGILSLAERNGDYTTIKNAADDIPSIAYQASSDRVINYPKLNQYVFGNTPENWLIGNYRKIYVGHVTDSSLRQRSSSGGILSGTQLYLLRKKLIDGAITLTMRDDIPYLTQPIIATTEADILRGTQSKYTVAPINQILASLPGKWKSLCYTGLPEQVASIRKLQYWKHPTVAPIQYILAPFYGETLFFSAVESILRSYKAGTKDDISTLAFREGEWPGNMRIQMKNGKTISVHKFYANYLSPSHVTPYSLWQVDYMGELADIASGDAWSPVYEERGKGWSVVIARTQKGEDLLEEMRRQNWLSLSEISEDELINMHSLGLDMKKRGSFIRMRWRRLWNLPIPSYGYEPINIPLKRVLFECVIATVLWIFHMPITIWILEHLPVHWIGTLFVYARKIWKRSTRSTKDHGLRNLSCRLIPLTEL